jgi:hypothetical protein
MRARYRKRHMPLHAGLLDRRGALLAALVVCLGAAVPHAAAGVAPPRGEPTRPVYETSFEQPVGPEWSSTTRTATPSGLHGSFLGEFGNDTVRLRLSSLPEHDVVYLAFNLYVLRSWDGSSVGCCGPDLWDLSVEGGASLVHTTFSNGEAFNRVDTTQAYPGRYPDSTNLPRTGAVENDTLGFEFTPRMVEDAVYHLRLAVPHTGSSIGFLFSGSALQPLNDESWGLDDVSVGVGSSAASVVIDRVEPPVVCPDGVGDTVALDVIGSGFDDEVDDVYFSRRPDGSERSLEVVSFAVVNPSTIHCVVTAADLQPRIPYFPFVDTASGVLSTGFGAGRHPRGTDAFVTLASTSVLLQPSGSATAISLRGACEPGLGPSAVRGDPGVVGYDVYVSSTPGVAPGPGTFLARIPANQPEIGVLSAAYYVVRPVSAAGQEGPPSNEVAAVPPRLFGIAVRGSKLVVTGAGFTDPSEILVDGIACAQSARVSSASKLTQTGTLADGRPIASYVTPGRAVTITVRTGSGLTSSAVLRRPA